MVYGGKHGASPRYLPLPPLPPLLPLASSSSPALCVRVAWSRALATAAAATATPLPLPSPAHARALCATVSRAARPCP